MLATCPDRDQLAAYYVGKLAEEPSAQIAEHLAECANCKRIASAVELLPDPLLDRLRQLKVHKPPTVDSNLPRLVARVVGSEPTPFANGPAVGGSKEALPEKIGEYPILALLGEGGMGKVYLADDTKLKRQVAIKIVLSRRLADSSALARFDREMAAQARLDHPNVARIFYAGVSEGLPFFAMEFVPGRSLRKVINQCGKLACADACELAYQAALGLQHAHEAGMIHRDIKPENLMLSEKGVVKLLDFGLLRFEEPPVGLVALKSSQQMMGTPDYMPPQQFDPSQPVDLRADIYALGCTLYELLSGQAPFASDKSLPEKMNAHLKKTPEPITHLPKELNAMIQKMLAKDPMERHGSAKEVADGLDRFRRDAMLARLLKAPPARKPETANKFNRPGRWRWAGAAALVAAVGGIALWFAFGQTFTVRTPQGTLELRFPKGMPASAKVVVDGNHVTLKGIDANKGEVTIDVGDRNLEVHDGQKVFRQDKVQIQRSRVTVVEVTMDRTNETSPELDEGPVEIANMGGFGQYPLTVRFSPTRLSAVTSEDANVAQCYLRIWDLQKRKVSATWGEGNYPVFSPDGRLVVSRQSTALNAFTDSATGKTVGTLNHNHQRGGTLDYSFTADGKSFLTSGSDDGFIRLWTFPAGKQSREFKHGNKCPTACFTVDDNYILSGGNDSIVRLWDISNDRQEKTFEGHESPIMLIRAMADGKRFVSVTDVGAVIVWDIKDGKQLLKFRLENVGGTSIGISPALALAAKGNRLLVGHQQFPVNDERGMELG